MTRNEIDLESYSFFTFSSLSTYDIYKCFYIHDCIDSVVFESNSYQNDNYTFQIEDTLKLVINDLSYINVIQKGNYIGFMHNTNLMHYDCSYKNLIDIITRKSLWLFKISSIDLFAATSSRSLFISITAYPIYIPDLCIGHFYNLKRYIRSFIKAYHTRQVNVSHRLHGSSITSVIFDEPNNYKMNMGIPMIEKIIFNEPNTVVKWADGTKTVVSAAEGETFSKEYGLAMAISKKFFEVYDYDHPRSAFKKAVESATDYTFDTKAKRDKKIKKKGLK